MGLYDMKRFYHFLAEASDEELAHRRQRLQAFLELASDADVIQDARYLLRRIEEEMLSRLG